MGKRSLAIGFVFAVLAMGATGCRKLKEPIHPEVAVTELSVPGKIPAEYGDLVAVTTAPGYEKTAQLWFVKPDKTIVVVGMNLEKLQVGPKVVTIERH